MSNNPSGNSTQLVELNSGRIVQNHRNQILGCVVWPGLPKPSVAQPLVQTTANTPPTQNIPQTFNQGTQPISGYTPPPKCTKEEYQKSPVKEIFNTPEKESIKKI